jgi:hypothetical protein
LAYSIAVALKAMLVEEKQFLPDFVLVSAR